MKEERPRIITIEELSSLKKFSRESLIIYYTQRQFESAIKGLKPSAEISLHGPGLDIFPIPGGPGYLAFPICWPGEVLVFGPKGEARCVPSDYPDGPPPEFPKTRGCSFRLGLGGRFGCRGRCASGHACIVHFGFERGRIMLRCVCPVQGPEPIEIVRERRGK